MEAIGFERIQTKVNISCVYTKVRSTGRGEEQKKVWGCFIAVQTACRKSSNRQAGVCTVHCAFTEPKFSEALPLP